MVARIALAIFLVAATAACGGGASAGVGTYKPVADLPAADGAEISGVTYGNGRYVAVGKSASTVGGAWTSTDGVTWSAVTAGFDRVALVSIVPSASGFIAAGGNAGLSGSEQGIVKAATSPDGTTWATSAWPAIEFEARSVTPGGPGYVTVGIEYADPMTARWNGGVATSIDGSAWAGVTSSTFDWARMNAVAKHGSMLVAVGASVQGPSAAVVWTSTDAVTWQRLPNSPAFAGAAMNAIVDGPSGLVAVGGGPNGAVVWTSPDGMTWTRLPDDPGFADGSMYAIAATSTGFTAVGYRQAGSVIWTSPDGTHWTRAADDPAFADAQMVGIVAGPRVVIVGRAAAGNPAQGHIWTGP